MLATYSQLMEVIAGSRLSTHFLKNHVEKQSSAQLLVGESMISFLYLTSSGVSSRNSATELQQVSLRLTDSTGGSTESVLLRIVSVFSSK